MRAPSPFGHLNRRCAHAADGPVHEHGLALGQAPAQLQGEQGGVVVEDKPGALSGVEVLGEGEGEVLGRHRRLGEAAKHAERATRSPFSNREPSLVSRTVPATSAPGTNGRSGLTWYSPRVCSTSGRDTPAASTSTTTPWSGVMK